MNQIQISLLFCFGSVSLHIWNSLVRYKDRNNDDVAFTKIDMLLLILDFPLLLIIIIGFCKQAF